MPLAVASIREIGKYLGLVPVSVPVIGTGSMYPSLFWEEGEGGPDNSSQRVIEEYRTNPHMYRYYPGPTILGRTYPNPVLGLGDLVTFESETTRSILTKEGKADNVGFIKRVVALPGDTVELRDGYFYRNGQLVEEPYLYHSRSTYGDSFLSDCQQLTVPAGSYFVMGDNRKVSADSRGELGFVKDADITYYLPYGQQQLYHSLWRDPSQDAALAGEPTLDQAEFYRLLNEVRLKRGLTPLTPSSTLVASATYKAKALLAGNDLSLADSLARAGYRNILTSEFSIRGRFTAKELLNNLLYFADSSAQVLDNKYDEIGVIAVNQEVNNCPTEVVVGHLGGYLPAEYDQGTLDSWQTLRDNLDSVIPSWQEARGAGNFDQAKLEELLTILARRRQLADEVLTVISNSEWLSSELQNRIEQDKIDAQSAKELIEELNN